MASISNAARTAYHLIISFYAFTWTCFTVIVAKTYGALKFMSAVYTPVKTFLLSTERAVELLKSNGNAPLDLKMKLVLEVFWGHQTSLETMGQMSVALPVSVVVLGSTSILLLVCSVVTAAFAMAALLMLPLGWGCAAGRATYHSCTSTLHSCNDKLRAARCGVVDVWRGKAKTSEQTTKLAFKPGAVGHSPTPADKDNQVDSSDESGSPRIATATEEIIDNGDTAVTG